MPVVHVFSEPRTLGDDVRSGLEAVVAAVTDALGLRDGDVIAAHVPTSTPVGADADWPVIVVHGSDRRNATAPALDRAGAALLAWAAAAGRPVAGVSTSWSISAARPGTSAPPRPTPA
jgi:hypothetical protein